MIPYSYSMVDMGGIDLAEANGTVVDGLYNRLALARNACGDLILYNWKFVGIEIAPSACSTLDEGSSIVINGTIEVTDEDVVTIISLPPPVPVEPLIVTENGTYTAEGSVSGFNPVEVNVPASQGGPVYSGATVPESTLGINEDLYVQYEIKQSPFNHTYGIVAEYRKDNGVWVPYTDPELPTRGAHIWTKSTGGSDAAMYVQAGYWDINSNTFVATGEVESVVYTSVQTWGDAKDCNGVALLAYPNDWQVKATTTVTDGTNIYQSGAIVKSWTYFYQVDFYVYKPLP